MTKETNSVAPNSGSMQVATIPWILIFLASVTMVAFAANSLLARAAFQTTTIDAASFTAIRLISGALTLALIASLQRQRLAAGRTGAWSALSLFTYAAAFSFAYRDISTGTGALILFASAQLLMSVYGAYKGERVSLPGLLVALVGLTGFLSPSTSTPPLIAASLMAIAGLAWGAFSLLGRSSGSPITSTASSFLWAVPLSLILLLIQRTQLHLDWAGVAYALISGSVTSAMGYAIWYWVRVRMTATSAGAVQLSVPILSAAMGVLLLGEKVSLQSATFALLTLLGVAWVTFSSKRAVVK